MALPAGVPVIELTTGPRLSASGRPMYLKATATIDRVIVHESTGAVIDPLKPVIFDHIGGRVYSALLPPVDASGFVDVNGNDISFWTYHIQIIASDNLVWSYDFQPMLTNVSPIDLDSLPMDIPQIDPVSGQRLVVNTVAGRSGDVDATELAVALAPFFGGGGGGGNEGGSDTVALVTHINSLTPHPVYDDGPSFLLLYQNAKV